MNINYMLISYIILLLSFIPFIFSFERRKPRAREVVLIAIISALTVLSNIICAYTLPFHAGTAMVILAGVAFGPETGFLVGAISRISCNFFMGQGMWTPWQMVAWGILGALAGILFSKPVIVGYFEDKKEVKRQSVYTGVRSLIGPIACLIFSEIVGYIVFIFASSKNDNFLGWWIYAFGFIGIVLGVMFGFVLKRTKLPANLITLSIFTFITVFVIYGGIMNMASMFMFSSSGDGVQNTISIGTLKLLYISGVPYDALHALGAAICVFLFGDTMIQKLERVKIKYGLYKGI